MPLNNHPHGRVRRLTRPTLVNSQVKVHPDNVEDLLPGRVSRLSRSTSCRVSIVLGGNVNAQRDRKD